jgi:hypothetical protein
MLPRSLQRIAPARDPPVAEEHAAEISRMVACGRPRIVDDWEARA